MSDYYSDEAPAPPLLCGCGGSRCKTDSKWKWTAEEDTPHWAMCFCCQGLLHYKDLPTTKWARKRIYLKDARGKSIPIYSKPEKDENGDELPRRIVGYKWKPGDFIYDDYGDRIPERKSTLCCNTDWCQYYRIPVREAKRHAAKRR